MSDFIQISRRFSAAETDEKATDRRDELITEAEDD